MLPTRGSWEEPRVPMSKLNFDEYRQFLGAQVKEIRTGQSYPLGIFHRETGCLLGHVRLTATGAKQRAIVDFRIFNIHWGKGFVKEAVAEAMKLAKHLKLGPVEIAANSKAKLKL